MNEVGMTQNRSKGVQTIRLRQSAETDVSLMVGLLSIISSSITTGYEICDKDGEEFRHV